MKILYFIESLDSGGKERRLVELIKGISKDPTISITLVLLKSTIHYKEIEDLDLEIISLNRKIGSKDLSIFMKFYRLNKRIKPDIIHVWGNIAALYAIPSKLVWKKPLLNNQISDAPRKVSKSLLGHRLTFNFSDKIIANSLAGLKAYGISPTKGTVIYNGFDFKRLDQLKPKAEILDKFNIKTPLVIGMVATFSNKKDYPTYLKAANKILDEREDITFLCVGRDYTTEHEQLVHSSHKERVLFLGKQANVESIMNSCDIGVLATYTEGIPNVVLEFMALGKPVIATDGGGTAELVHHERNGYLITAEKPQELYARLKQLLEDEHLMNTFGAESKKIVKEKFSISKMIESFKNIYTTS